MDFDIYFKNYTAESKRFNEENGDELFPNPTQEINCISAADHKHLLIESFQEIQQKNELLKVLT